VVSVLAGGGRRRAMDSRFLWRTQLAVGLALALAVAGCGDDDEPSGQGGGESGPTQLTLFG
jgi:hypothetical protein